ncbi:hypothetical protein TNCT_132811 [Trichonephila clavata]|uniref:Reverse transcriptase domain-containing protein n=1 Tax=Trichonephila clavata TaxID=2740835 RepID=A0A8X6L6J8_TRICU|nr:hypothetical protein TNCT_132811 [Trichonephila clavata]
MIPPPSVTGVQSLYRALHTSYYSQKLSDRLRRTEVLSSSKKVPSGGSRAQAIFSEHLETARRDKCERFVAWLDSANAFGSIPHGVILESLRRNGVDQDFTYLVENIYTKAATRVLTEEALLTQLHSEVGSSRVAPGGFIRLSIVHAPARLFKSSRKQGLSLLLPMISFYWPTRLKASNA